MTDPVPGLLNPYDISPEEKKSIQMQNLWGALLQGGMGLMAAGSRVSDGQRAQLLMQAAQPLANMGAMNQAMMQSASREKLNAAAAQRLAQQDQASAEVRQMINSPEFSAQLDAAPGMNPHMKTLLLGAAKMGNFGPALSAVTPKKPAEAPAGYRWNADGTQSFIPGGLADPAQAGALAGSKRNLKPIPAKDNEELSAGVSTIQNIDKALGIISTPQPGDEPSQQYAAWMSKNVPVVGSAAAQFLNPSGANFRATISDVSSQIQAARSGLAVTESEARRLTDMLPDASDRPEIIVQKLQRIRENMSGMLRDRAAQYTEENGFIPHVGVQRLNTASQKAATAQGLPKAGDVMDNHRFKGGNPADKNNWEPLK